MSPTLSLRRLLTGALALALALVLSPAARAAQTQHPFSDVPEGIWYGEAVQYMWENGLMGGTSASTFSPEGSMTRAMMAVVLYHLAGSPEVTGQDTFEDTAEGSWYSAAVLWAQQGGYIGGYNAQRFGPDDPLTREQLSVILWKYAGQPQAGSPNTFSDSAAVSDWAAAAVDWAADTDLVGGKPGNLFDPAGEATRAEFALILTRYCQQFYLPPEPEQPQEPDDPDTPEEPEEPETPPQPELPPRPESPLAPNEYDPELFTLSEEGFLVYEGDAPSYVGVDVSFHQGEIDWEQVAEAGVDFAMIRVGYRGYTEGGIYQDAYFLRNIQGALDAGLEVGIYFFSQAVTIAEAEEEARQTLEWIQGYDITFPVVFDWERVDGEDSRTNTVSGQQVTHCAAAFCALMEEAGYLPMTYGSPSKIGADLLLTQLTDYPFWLAHYTAGWAPTAFPHHYHMWQYSSYGTVPGIQGRVDLNLCLTDWTEYIQA